MPACVGLGRLIACDLIGMGDSDKLPNSGPERYTYVEQPGIPVRPLERSSVSTAMSSSRDPRLGRNAWF